MNELACFAGDGGGILGGLLLGWRTVCAVEYGEHQRSVLMQRQDDGILEPFPVWDDIRTFDGREWRGAVDVVSGGFPCQVNSHAARGNNTAEDLWPEMRRVVADAAPWCVWAENVTKRAIDHAADDLEALGYRTKAIRFSAADVGADHIRERYWVLAYADSHRELLRSLYAEMAGVPRLSPSVWSRDPGISRVSDGMADRMVRIESTGNGQVPLVAACAFLECVGAILGGCMTPPLTANEVADG